MVPEYVLPQPLPGFEFVGCTGDPPSSPKIWPLSWRKSSIENRTNDVSLSVRLKLTLASTVSRKNVVELPPIKLRPKPNSPVPARFACG